MWDWTTHCLVQSIDVGEDSAPLEIRFLHNPDSVHGMVGCTLESSIHHFFQAPVRKRHRLGSSEHLTTGQALVRTSESKSEVLPGFASLVWEASTAPP